MKIEQVTLQNFRSFGPEPTTLSLHDGTALIGGNGSGKTNALTRSFACSAPRHRSGRSTQATCTFLKVSGSRSWERSPSLSRSVSRCRRSRRTRKALPRSSIRWWLPHQKLTPSVASASRASGPAAPRTRGRWTHPFTGSRHPIPHQHLSRSIALPPLIAHGFTCTTYRQSGTQRANSAWCRQRFSRGYSAGRVHVNGRRPVEDDLGGRAHRLSERGRN